MTKKQIEKIYDCTIHLDYIDGFRFYQAYANDKINSAFESANGYNLNELIENIENNQLEREVK